MKKTFLIVIIISVLALTLSACGEVTLTNTFLRNSVVQTIEISVSVDDAGRYGYSRAEILDIIETVFTDYGREVTREDGKIKGTIVFDSASELAADAVGYGYTAVSAEETRDFFFTRYKTILKSRFSDIDNWPLTEHLLTTYFDKAAEFDAEAVTYVFNYATIYRSIDSNGAETSEDGIYTHTWTVKPDTELVLTKTTEFSAGWYVLAIASSFVFIAALAFAAKRAKRNNPLCAN
ncbi:MAG: hypothetical protein ACOYIN_03845 [Christensenellales bacterium]|nr:hypothetical protein [Clostridia bacterium]HRU84888.1 hypothetical protein [Eubacteriales bacterium]